MNRNLKIIFVAFLFFFLNSCNEFQKLLRNEDVKLKYEMAEKYYENGEGLVHYLNKFNHNTEVNHKEKELLFFMQIVY